MVANFQFTQIQLIQAIKQFSRVALGKAWPSPYFFIMILLKIELYLAQSSFLDDAK